MTTREELGYTDESLARMAVQYLRVCKPKEYRELRRSGELNESVRLRVEGAKRYANALIATGMFEPQAWSMAVRSEILESESD